MNENGYDEYVAFQEWVAFLESLTEEEIEKLDKWGQQQPVIAELKQE